MALITVISLTGTDSQSATARQIASEGSVLAPARQCSDCVNPRRLWRGSGGGSVVGGELTEHGLSEGMKTDEQASQGNKHVLEN